MPGMEKVGMAMLQSLFLLLPEEVVMSSLSFQWLASPLVISSKCWQHVSCPWNKAKKIGLALAQMPHVDL